MLELILVRHAKSSRKYNFINDVDRPLNGTGYTEALEMAHKLKSKGYVPKKIFSSVAVRAYSTALIFSQVLYSEIKLSTVPELYEISTRDLLSFISQLDPQFNSVMIFGHNPSFSSVAESFDPAFFHVPTAGVVRLVFESKSWSNVGDYNLSESEILQP
jgi:phosphohistidine phosphatase